MQYDKEKYKAIQLPNWMLLHWLINPAMAINELVLGQRIPKLSLIDQHSDRPLLERQLLPCPHCNTLHNALRWSKSKAFGNWFGLLCPHCKNDIPCILNYTSVILLALTAPIWFWFHKPLKQLWRAKKLQKMQASETQPTSRTRFPYLKMGIFFGLFMLLFSLVMLQVQANFTLSSVLTAIGVNILGGIFFGGWMKFVLERKK